MGGGKTHCLVTLGMLAKHPEQRRAVLADLPDGNRLPAVRVVAFSGRETDVPHGIWGEIAAQLGKFDQLKDYYAPLQPPGRGTWINLLGGEPTLILLDELPPYLDNAKSVAIGNSDLSKVTATALTNLFEAVAEPELSNVCVVLTDLVGTYAEASAQIAGVLSQLQNEAQRHSMNLTPVQMNTDEFFHILRKRLFKVLPSESQIDEVAQAYAKVVREAKQMDITAQSPEQFAQAIKSSYPFHPAIKDLYARFRENPGFQQTRALIRLMRIVAARLWQSGEAGTRSLIAVHDLDLNDAETLSEIRQINSNLENAIAHDIASQGQAVAELMDANLDGSDARDVCRLLLVASLANVPNAIVGLSIPELVAYLCAPGRNLAKLKGEVLEKLATAAWYLHADRDKKLYFRNVQNLNAKLESLAGAYVRESAIKELRKRLEEAFRADNGWCYQTVLALPAVDEIRLAPDKLTLVISEPLPGQSLNPELRKFWEQTEYRNRVLFLTGARNTFEGLITAAKRLKAIHQIIEEMRADPGILPSDPQLRQADELKDRLLNQFLSAVKETFSTLHYPTGFSDPPVLTAADFAMRFESNRYNGEQQVLEVLKSKDKFTDDVSSDTFRKKVERFLFTTEVMLWSQIVQRAATTPKWQWHRPDGLQKLKDELLHKEVWRDGGGDYVDRKPPPPKTTRVDVQELTRDDDTGRFKLRVTPVHGDLVYADVGAQATSASHKIEGAIYETDAMEVSFLAVDSTGAHPSGEAHSWRNRLSLKYRLYQGARGERRVELKAAPNAEGHARIRYTTDGSSPESAGGVYDAAVELRPGTPLVLAVAERDGIKSEVLRISLDWSKPADTQPIDPVKPAIWKREQRHSTTLEAYAFIEHLEKHGAAVSSVRVYLAGDRWAEANLHERIELPATALREIVEVLRKLPGTATGQVEISASALHFSSGQHLLDWVHEARCELAPGEVKQ